MRPQIPEAIERPDLRPQDLELLRVVRNQHRQFCVSSQPAELLPELDLPIPTEPAHRGRSFDKPAPQRIAPRRRSHLSTAVTALAAVVSALLIARWLA